MRMFLSLVLVLAIAVPPSRFAVEARPSGATSCLPGPNIFPSFAPHFRAEGALGTLMDAGIVASIAGIGNLDAATGLLTGQSYELELSGGTFRGFLQRLSSSTDKDLSGSFSIPEGEANAQLLISVGEGAVGGGSNGLAACAATVAGATHLNGRISKTSVKTTIEIPANQVGDAVLEITVVVNTATWYYSRYSLAITQTEDSPVPDTSEVTKVPVATDSVTDPPTGTNPYGEDAGVHFVLSLWVGLIMFSAPIFFLAF